MAVNVTANIRQAMQALEAERKRIGEQIAALQRVLVLLDGRGATPAKARVEVVPTARKRHGMSAKARQAVSERMKAYWAKRKAVEVKRKRR